MPVGIGRLLHWHRHWNASGCLRRNRVVRSRDRQFLDIGRFACSEVRRPPIQAERTACKVAMGSYSCGGHFDGRRHLHVPCCDGLKAVLKLDLPSPGNQIPDLGDLAIKTAFCVLPPATALPYPQLQSLLDPAIWIAAMVGAESAMLHFSKKSQFALTKHTQIIQLHIPATI